MGLPSYRRGLGKQHNDNLERTQAGWKYRAEARYYRGQRKAHKHRIRKARNKRRKILIDALILLAFIAFIILITIINQNT